MHPIKDLPTKNTALHNLIHGFTYDGALYVHNSNIIEWPNKELAAHLNSWPISVTMWKKKFGDPQYSGPYTCEGVKPEYRMIVGYKSDRWFITSKWMISITRDSSIPGFYVRSGTTPDELMQIAVEITEKFKAC